MNVITSLTKLSDIERGHAYYGFVALRSSRQFASVSARFICGNGLSLAIPLDVRAQAQTSNNDADEL